MCGIVGIIAKERNIANDLLSALLSLEYRGYDSSGIALMDKNLNPTILKCMGRVGDLIKKHSENNISGFVGIAHTRWATHGVPSDANSHPHTSCNIAVVHNGVIENYEEIKNFLIKEGYVFTTQTDTESVAHLAHYLLQINSDIHILAKELMKRMNGAFALAIIIGGRNEILAIRNGSPLVIGLGSGENYLASDVYAMQSLTQNFVNLESGEYAILSSTNVHIFDKTGNNIVRQSFEKHIDILSPEKLGYDTFMMKEIHEQPDVIRKLLKEHVRDNNLVFTNLNLNLADFSSIAIIACGSSYYASMTGKYILEEFAQIPVSIDIASEFRYKKVINKAKVLYIFISQSGETADSIAAMKYTRENIDKTSNIAVITNVAESTMVSLADGFIECNAGKEIGVAATKSFIAQIVILYLIAMAIKPNMQIIEELKMAANILDDVIFDGDIIANIKSFAESIQKHPQRAIIYTGKNILYPIALEGALKLQELSYIPTQGIASGELKHGPLAIIDNSITVIVLDHSKNLHNKAKISMEEAVSRNANIMLVSDISSSLAHFFIDLKVVSNLNATIPIIYAAIVQLISYHVCRTLNLDADKPRNLAKSVTVE